MKKKTTLRSSAPLPRHVGHILGGASPSSLPPAASRRHRRRWWRHGPLFLLSWWVTTRDGFSARTPCFGARHGGTPSCGGVAGLRQGGRARLHDGDCGEKDELEV